MKKNLDSIGSLESDLFDVLGEARLGAQLLALQLATARGLALALSEAHSRTSGKLLISLMAAENKRPRPRARRKARKGSHGPVQ